MSDDDQSDETGDERLTRWRLLLGEPAAAGLGVELKIPPIELCTDNAAMIASAARWVEPLPFPDYLGLDAYATRRAA